jgi:hypothetical protein
MTTFQDPKPQSRRAARQSERGESAESQVAPDSFSAQPTQQAPQYYSNPATSGDMWDTTARRAAQLPPAAPQEPAPTSGRRSSAPEGPPSGEPLNGEPLNYSTQARQPVPSYDGPSFRREPVPQQPEDALPPTQALQQADQPAYRVRDFSPEAGRRAAAPTPTWGSETQAPSDLDYYTQVGGVPALQAPAAPFIAPPVFSALPEQAAPAAPSAAPVEESAEHTLSRRELRAIQEREHPVDVPELQEPQGIDLFDTLLHSGPIELPLLAPPPQPTAGLSSAMAEFDALTSGSQLVEPAPWNPAPAQPTNWALAQPEPIAAVATTAPASEPAAWPNAATGAVVQAPPLAQPLHPAEPGAWSPPVGHWSTQADLDDETQPYESTINRTIGSGTATTNALVLPSIPQQGITGALTSTGEVMLTGSIDLPLSLGATGTSAHMDDDGLDRLFDANDQEISATDSAPVRAIRAVSTHNSNGHGVTHTQKPKGTRMLTVLIVSAVAMAVVAVGLLIVAFATGVF